MHWSICICSKWAISDKLLTSKGKKRLMQPLSKSVKVSLDTRDFLLGLIVTPDSQAALPFPWGRKELRTFSMTVTKKKKMHHRINQCRTILEKICQEADLIAVCEHWLTSLSHVSVEMNSYTHTKGISTPCCYCQCSCMTVYTVYTVPCFESRRFRPLTRLFSPFESPSLSVSVLLYHLVTSSRYVCRAWYAPIDWNQSLVISGQQCAMMQNKHDYPQMH